MAIHYLNINNKELYVETHGKITGKAILYLHGGPGEECFDFSMNQTHRLNNFFRLVVIDQRGVCRSEEIFKEESFGINHLIEDCEELRVQLGISKWSIIGHSFGGYLAVLYANRYPYAIEKIIFECPTFDFELTAKSLLKRTASFFARYNMIPLQKKVNRLIAKAVSPKELVEGYLQLSSYLKEKRMEIYSLHSINLETSIYTDEQWDRFYDKSEIHFARLRNEGKIFESVLPLLKKIQVPSLLIVGEYDPVTCEKQIDFFDKNVRQGEIQIIEQCGHTPHNESPEWFSKMVTEFLLWENH
ncbi:alpha/beta hydrolase [Niallia sp. FSL W8-0951]|uniref:alpha/beta fold hydrolase n=1 Tax=Niallia sp. FSL W8-0951 TaxID=2954639 RepID=UPI0030F8B95D